jgi:hypothetical protein
MQRRIGRDEGGRWRAPQGILTSGFVQQDLVARYGSQTTQSYRANDRHGAVEETLCAQEQVDQPASSKALRRPRSDVVPGGLTTVL